MMASRCFLLRPRSTEMSSTWPYSLSPVTSSSLALSSGASPDPRYLQQHAAAWLAGPPPGYYWHAIIYLTLYTSMRVDLTTIKSGP
jgi:hypothetical protein